MLVIPKVIHFIWLGPKPLFPESQENILAFTEMNPDFHIRLWIDEQSEAGIRDRLAEHLPLGQITLHHVPLGGVDDPARYEIERMRPNYGAASDLLRYRILEREGGIYYDIDVKPPRTPLAGKSPWAPIPEGAPDIHALYIAEFGSELPNDMIACTPGSPIMRRIREAVERNYYYRDVPADREMSRLSREYRENQYGHRKALVYRFDEVDSFVQSTLRRTGPRCVKGVIDEMVEANQAETINLLAAREEKAGEEAGAVGVANIVYYVVPEDLRQPLEDTKSFASWLRQPVFLPDSLFKDEIIRLLSTRILREIGFEARNIGILRLDDHINALQESLKTRKRGLTSQDMSEAINFLISCLAAEVRRGSIDLTHVYEVQLTFQHDQTRRFYETYGLMGKTGVFPTDEKSELNGIMYGYHYTLKMQSMFELGYGEKEAGGPQYNRALFSGFLGFYKDVLQVYWHELNRLHRQPQGGLLIERMIRGLEELLNRIECEKNLFDALYCDVLTTLSGSIKELTDWCRIYVIYHQVCCIPRICYHRPAALPLPRIIELPEQELALSAGSLPQLTSKEPGGVGGGRTGIAAIAMR